MLEEEVPCDKESNHRSITGFRSQADNAKRSSQLEQVFAEGNPSETCICSVGIGSRSSQLEQHASLFFAAVDDSATLMVVGSVHRAPVGGCGLLRGERLLA
jgi:hypothetical protein